MTSMKTIILIPLLSAICIAASTFGQDPVKTSPQYYKVLLENDRVRVTETSYKPGADSGMVQRSDRVVRALTDGTLEKITPDGKKEIIEWKTGQVRYGKKETYSQKNIGKTDLVLFVTNLK